MRTLLVALALAVVAERSMACSCVRMTLRYYFDHSPAVFVAKLISVKQSVRVVVPKGAVLKVRVLESWKGVRAGQVVYIATGNGGGDCGYDFEDSAFRGDSIHLVFAQPIPKRASWFVTDNCTGTKSMRTASVERDTLNSWEACGVIPLRPDSSLSPREKR